MGAVVLVLGLGSFSQGPQAGEAAFLRGDSNIDGERDIADAIQMILCSFAGTGCSSCADAADANDDGERGVADPIYLLYFLFLEGPQPPAPGETCGTDPTGDGLDCQSFPPCAGKDTIPTSRGELEIIPIDHASLVLRWDGKTIYVDPVGGADLYEGLPAADLALVTHAHGDHMNAGTLGAVIRQGTVLVVPQSVSTALSGSAALAVAEERVLANGESADLGDIQIDALPMYNLTAGRLNYHTRGDGNGYVLDLEGTRVYISGDTEDIPEMRALRDINLAFICMNLPYTMTPQQAASAVLEFQPAVVYPYHYRGENPETFKSLVEESSENIEVRLRDWYQ